MIRLTMMPNLDVDEGRPTPAYIDPYLIQVIYRAISVFHHYGTTNPQPARNATVVYCGGNQALHVLETPEQVAMLRERALGHEPQLQEVK